MRHLGTCMALCASCALPPSISLAQPDTYPDRAVRIVVPFPAGGPTDVLARVIAQELSKNLGQSFLIENKGGGNTVIGAEQVARAKPDGYTLLMAIDNTLVMNQYLYSKLPYDPIKDFTPIGRTAISPLIIIGDSKGPQTTEELIRQIRANPGRLSYGFGTFTSQLAGEVIKSRLKLDMQSVPYKGSNGNLQGMLAGDVTFIIDGITAALPHIKSGRLRALANLGTQDIPALPGVPSLSTEAKLPDFDVSVWMGLVAPSGTPAQVISKLNAAVQSALNEDSVREKLLSSGLLPAPSSAAEFGKLIESEAKKWQPVIEQANMRVQ